MNRRRFVGVLGTGLAAGLVPRRALSFARPGDDQFVERWSWAMGQAVHVMVFARSESEGLDACAAALAELRRVESRLTLFDTASDLCELNRCAGRRAFRADSDLLRVLEHAERYRRATGGAFNVAVEPLMKAWGFHAPRRDAPSAREIDAARDAVQAAVVKLDGDRVELPSGHTQLDFGGIAVGYGIDRVLAVLRERGITRAFIDVSGDCAALGPPPGAAGWRVDVVDPRTPRGILRTVHIRGSALATSANTESVLHYGRRSIGHVMNPATGWPAHRVTQATVIAQSALAADALSTAVLVSGRRPEISGLLQVLTV